MGKEQKTLDVSFRTPEEFQREYATNIMNGGIFVATGTPLQVRERVSVRLKLRYARKGITLPGEVVHVVGPELAVTGGVQGVAVQFEVSPIELREVFRPLLPEVRPEPAAPPPKAAESEVRKPGPPARGGAAPPGFAGRTAEAREAKPGGPKAAKHGGKRETKEDAAPAQRPEDRRSAPRLRARVRARVHCPGCEIIEGRTRDLSISGVLVSIGNAPAIAVGEPVRVFITNPQSGVEREILGKVARHVKGEGDVIRAIGVQFYVPDSGKASVETFLAELNASEHSRHLGGIKGAISELGLANLVQTFGVASREGTLDVMRGAEEGYLAFEGGCLRAAALGGVSGIKALARMLSWSEGTFEFHARVDPALPRGEAITLEVAVLEAMRLVDESSQVDRSSFAPDVRFRVDATARRGADDLSKVDEAILDLASAGMSVQRILDIVPESDSEIFLALWTLCERGLLAIRTD
jgi:Tfp pilus assembly protein PilZ